MLKIKKFNFQTCFLIYKTSWKDLFEKYIPCTAQTKALKWVVSAMPRICFMTLFKTFAGYFCFSMTLMVSKIFVVSLCCSLLWRVRMLVRHVFQCSSSVSSSFSHLDFKRFSPRIQTFYIKNFCIRINLVQRTKFEQISWQDNAHWLELLVDPTL